VCHLKAKNQADFEEWLEHIKQHRLYYQYKYSQPANNSNSKPQMDVPDLMIEKSATPHYQ
jgi:hypothetical protein